VSATHPVEAPNDSVPKHISQNIDDILSFYRREDDKVTYAQRLLGQVGGWLGRPWSLVVMVCFVIAWSVANLVLGHLGLAAPDPPPFNWLQAIVSLSALLITTVVLIAQNREAKLEAQRSELELQVNLLTEQKTTKLIRLLEELRHDLPMVKDRHDAEAAAMQQKTDTRGVLTALEERRDKE
jgi:uncharacterized membrane protein